MNAANLFASDSVNKQFEFGPEATRTKEKNEIRQEKANEQTHQSSPA